MQSYKLRKNTETSLYPIEDELRKLRNENDKNWTTLMLKMTSVVFSGIGTTLVCQKEFLPTFIDWLVIHLGIDIAIEWLYVIELLLAIGIFIIISFVSFIVIDLVNKNTDNKKNNDSRKHTAEYFHKVILNNVITGVSFCKKAKSKIEAMEEQDKVLETEIIKEKSDIIEKVIPSLKQEGCLYIAQAIFYLELAQKEFDDENIIEVGNRSNYIEYLREVGIITLMETLKMHEKALDELTDLVKKLARMKCCNWEQNQYELVVLIDTLTEISDIKKEIIILQTNLRDTIEKMREKS